MTHDDMSCGFESYENDWLEVKYATPEQMEEEQKQQGLIEKTVLKAKQKFMSKKEKGSKKRFSFSSKKLLKPVGICALIALLVAGIFFVDGGFVGDVFSYAKDNVTNTSGQNAKTTLSLPANATVQVSGDEVTLTGGSIAVNFVQGKVTDVTESSVTVCNNDGFGVVYSNLSEVMVAKDDVVGQYHVLGKYDQNAMVSLLQDGQKITGVTADGYTLSW